MRYWIVPRSNVWYARVKTQTEGACSHIPSFLLACDEHLLMARGLGLNQIRDDAWGGRCRFAHDILRFCRLRVARGLVLHRSASRIILYPPLSCTSPILPLQVLRPFPPLMLYENHRRTKADTDKRHRANRSADRHTAPSLHYTSSRPTTYVRLRRVYSAPSGTRQYAGYCTCKCKFWHL